MCTNLQERYTIIRFIELVICKKDNRFILVIDQSYESDLKNNIYTLGFY